MLFFLTIAVSNSLKALLTPPYDTEWVLQIPVMVLNAQNRNKLTYSVGCQIFT